MKYTKKDIGKAINRQGMTLYAIESVNQLTHDYTTLPFNCYTYEGQVAYYWVKKESK